MKHLWIALGLAAALAGCVNPRVQQIANEKRDAEQLLLLCLQRRAGDCATEKAVYEIKRENLRATQAILLQEQQNMAIIGSGSTGNPNACLYGPQSCLWR